MEALPEISRLSMTELSRVVSEMGEPGYRNGQIYDWLHSKCVQSFDEMTNIPAGLRKKLGERYRMSVMDPVEIQVSRVDGARKYAFSLYDSHVIEAVCMRYRHGLSVCISSQVGCSMGCSFCASAIGGSVRNLSAAEMLSEVYSIGRDVGERIGSIVIMGTGEPLMNYDEVIRFIRMISDPAGQGISLRKITLSTCGIIERIYELSREMLPITLAVSLHAPEQSLRERIMPIAKKYEITALMEACRHYSDASGRRVSFEYMLIKGVNDSPSDAHRLAGLMEHMGTKEKGGSEGAVHINLIRFNPVAETPYDSPDPDTVRRFRTILEEHHVNVTLRLPMGRDLDSACGQLRRRYIK